MRIVSKMHRENETAFIILPHSERKREKECEETKCELEYECVCEK